METYAWTGDDSAVIVNTARCTNYQRLTKWGNLPFFRAPLHCQLPAAEMVAWPISGLMRSNPDNDDTRIRRKTRLSGSHGFAVANFATLNFLRCIAVTKQMTKLPIKMRYW